MTQDYVTAWDALTETIGAARDKSSGRINDLDHLNIDQRLKVIQIAALLAISEEISALNPNNTTTRGADGTVTATPRFDQSLTLRRSTDLNATVQ